MTQGLKIPENLFLREDDAVITMDRSDTEKCRVFSLPEGFLMVVTDHEEDMIRVVAEENLSALAKTIREDFLANEWRIRRIAPELVLPKT